MTNYYFAVIFVIQMSQTTLSWKKNANNLLGRQPPLSSETKQWWKPFEDTWDATLSGNINWVIESDTAPLSSEEYWNSTTQLRNSECHPWISSDADGGRQRSWTEQLISTVQPQRCSSTSVTWQFSGEKRG